MATTRISKRNLLIAAAVVVIVAILGYWLIASRAAGFFVRVDPQNTTVSGNASLVTESDGSQALRFNAPVVVTPPPTPTPGPQNCPAYPAFPNEDCTGVSPGVTLTDINGDYTASRAGEVVEGKRIKGKLYVTADNVVVKNSEIYGGVTGYNGGNPRTYAVSDSTIGPVDGCNSDVAMGFEKYTATRVHIRNFGDGFRDSGNDILIQDSFVQLCSKPGDHSDGFQGYGGGTNVRLIHTTIDQRQAEDVTSPIFVADGSRGIVAQNNLFAGGGYTVRLYGTGFTFTGNKVVDKSWQYGPVSSDCGGISWSNNSLVTINAAYQVLTTVRALEC